MEIINYEPVIFETPDVIRDRRSAWEGLECILKDIIERFNIDPKIALEFGVEFGFSTSALSNYFEKVIGIDTFIGEFRTIWHGQDHFKETSKRLNQYQNIELIQSKYQDWVKTADQDIIYDLIHVDIIHTYLDTYNCGDWSVNHSKVTLFHDTESYPDVKRACRDLALRYNLEFYNYPKSFGLGILINRNI